MPATMTQMFQSLTSFAPGRVDLRDGPWEAFVDWAVGQGLAPIAAYNLEYRLGGAGAPEWARDRLMSLYQGTLNDNVMKLVNFKRAVDDLEGRKIVLLGAGSFAESLYPHVAFRPVLELRLLVPPADLDGFVGFMKNAEFKPEAVPAEVTPSDAAVSDGRTLILLDTKLTPDDDGLRARSLRLKVMGPSMFRLDLEDAILVQVLLCQKALFEVPMLEWIDLRELVLGAPSMGHVYSRPFDAKVILERAHAWGLDKSLYAAMAVVAKLFPETAALAKQLEPDVGWTTRELIDRLLVAPVAEIGRAQGFKLEGKVRELLTGA